VSKALAVAILGFGGRAEGFAQYALDHPNDARVAAVADPSPQRQRRAREMLGDVRMFDSGESFYDSGMAVDGVWVISQERTHADLAVPALERGLPLISEKPLATTARDAYRIVDAYERNTVPFVIPHSLRYLPVYRKVKEIVDSGQLGRILHIHAFEQIDDGHTVGYYRRGPGMYRANTTFLLAKCSHDIDIINWMMSGVKAKSVACFGGADYFKPRAEVPGRCTDDCVELSTCAFAPPPEQRATADVDASTKAVLDWHRCAWNSGAEQVDHQTIIIQFENGTTADFTLKCFGDNRRPIQITGSHGTVYAELYSNEVKLMLYHPQKVQTWGKEELRIGNDGPHGGGDWALIADWINAVRTGAPTRSASVQESAEAVAVCIAADRAMLEHRIVEMEEIRGER